MYRLHTWCDAPTSTQLELLFRLKNVPHTLVPRPTPSITELVEAEVDAPSRALALDGEPLPEQRTLEDIIVWLEHTHAEPQLLTHEKPPEEDPPLEEAFNLHRQLHPLVCAFRWFSPHNETVLRASLQEHFGKLRWKIVSVRVRRAMKMQLRIDPKELSKLVPRFDQVLRSLDSRLEEVPFICGNQLNICDVIAYTHLTRASYYCEGKRISQHPQLIEWLQRMARVLPLDRPEWAEGHDFIPKKRRSGYQLKSLTG